MDLDRRRLMAAGGLGLGLGIAGAGPADAANRSSGGAVRAGAEPVALVPDSPADQTRSIQAALDAVRGTGGLVLLPPGRFVCGPLSVHPGTWLEGAGAATVLTARSGVADAALILMNGSEDVTLASLRIEGGGRLPAAILLEDAQRVRVSRVSVNGVSETAIRLERASGTIDGCEITEAGEAGIFSRDAAGLAIRDCAVSRCGNNGILVWRSAAGEDGTLVTGNRVAQIRADAGGSGQNGNGINVFRASGVTVSNNRITDCAYSAVRGNAASNITVVSNSCERIGEVALYAEFGFEGAIVSGNLVDTAATGISVVNLDHGGRLAVVSGNLVRNVFRREHEPVDTRGEGISVEADAAVSGNTIEGAATAGISVGWGPYMRDVAVTGNVIRQSACGIRISSDPAGGACLIAQNLISGAREGAIRAMDHGRLVGPDLAREETSTARIRIAGNLPV